MRIGLMTPGWPGENTPNGIATAVFHLANGLVEAGHQPVILTTDIDGPLPEGIPVVTIAQRGWGLRQKIAHKLGQGDVQQEVVAESIAAAVDEAREAHKIDVLIIEETQGWSDPIARRGQIPVVVFLHGPWLLHKSIQGRGSARDDRRREQREERAMKSARALISPSQNVLDAVEEAIDVTDIPRIVIPNSFAPQAPAAPIAAPGPLLFVGRFDKHKGGDTVLEAFRLLHARHPDARLTFAGPHPGVRRPDGTLVTIEDALAVLPDDTRAALSVLGRQSAEAVAKLRQTHPIAIIASRYENLNYTMLEAMAAGQAIISTRVGGPAEVFEDEKTALLVPPDDPEAMAAALERVWSDPGLAGQLGAAAQARVAADFHPKGVAERIVTFLTESL